ncbi:MAG: hypothetical protein RMM06_00740 [Armatimonadota bacterium]|nr:hypothetical protein [Armatimonadota bacterium]MDW8289220.1 hypothetical protein [Armatimonadota bacterium]
MVRLLFGVVLLLWSVPLLAQEQPWLYQKCYGTGTVLITSATPNLGGTVEVAVRSILAPEDVVPPDDPLAGKLVFRTVTPSVSTITPLVLVTVVMHDVDKYAMERPFVATFSGPATAYIGFSRRGVKGKLEVTVADLRDPTDALGPSLMLFDTVKMTFVPENVITPYQLQWEGVVWKGDLVVFERLGR